MDSAAIWVAIIAGIPGIVAAVSVFKTSGKANENTERQNDLAWVKEIRQDAADARKDIDALQDQVRTLTRQLAVVTREAEHWISEYQFLHRTLFRPGISLERVREIVGPPPIDPPMTLPGKRMVRDEDSDET